MSLVCGNKRKALVMKIKWRIMTLLGKYPQASTIHLLNSHLKSNINHHRPNLRHKSNLVLQIVMIPGTDRYPLLKITLMLISGLV